MFRKKKQVVDMNVCEGIRIGDTIYSKKENRLLTLLYKGLIVYFLSASGVCGIMSAAGTKHTAILINIVIFIAAMYVVGIHYSKKWETVGNIIFLIVIVILGFGLSLYINTGFYAVINDLNEEAKLYFDYTGIKTYAEPMNNRLLSVNIAGIAIGIICCFMHYMWITKMSYLDSILLVILMYVYPAYIQCEPDLIYVIMALCATVMMYILKRSTHYSVKQEDSVLEVEAYDSKKFKLHGRRNEKLEKKISYVYNIKAISGVGIQVLVAVFAVVLLMQIVVPKKTYYDNDYDTKLKNQTKEQVGNFIRQGLAGLYSFYNNVAGMSDGKLGGVGIVSLDYNTDFKLRVTPYSEDTIYLKETSYMNYVPYSNRWLSIFKSMDIYEAREYELGDYNEAVTLKGAYEDTSNKQNKYTAKGILEIENVGLVNADFKPYYTNVDEDEKVSEKTRKYMYYPRLDKTDVIVKKNLNMTPYLRYPKDNEKTIAKLIKDAKIKSGMDADTIVAKLANYYQKEIPYTLNPGTTPFEEDFINYFLEEHRKGYCVHFASAATLAFRYMGIPARYVEGYAVSFDEVLSGTALKNKNYSDYYDGYSELGETALIEVEVTDASAHAWVEIYDEKYGWKPVEVTPSASNEENDTGSFWNRFMGIFLGGGADGEIDDTTQNKSRKKDNNKEKNADILASDAVRGLVIILIGALIIWIIFIGIRYILYRIKYNRANINDKLIYDYSNLIRKRRRKHVLLREKMNYRDQVEYLYKQRMFRMPAEESVVDELASILDKAGFSQEYISDSDNTFIRDVLGLN